MLIWFRFDGSHIEVKLDTSDGQLRESRPLNPDAVAVIFFIICEVKKAVKSYKTMQL